MKRLLLVVIVAVMAIGLYGQEEGSIEDQGKVRLELIWEKAFVEPIWDYIVENNEKGEPELRFVGFLGDDSIKTNFITHGGKIEKQLDLKTIYGGKILVSANKKYIGISQVTKRTSEGISEVTFSLYDKDGNLLWSKQKLKARPTRVLPNSLMLSGESPWSSCLWTLRDQSGIRKWLKVGKETDFGTGSLDISQNGYIVFNIMDRDGAVLVLYDNTGNEVWRKRFDWKWTGKVNISSTGKYIATIGEPDRVKLYLFSSDGGKLWEYPSDNCEFMAFSPDEEYFVGGIRLDRIQLFHSKTGRLLFSYELPDPKRVFSIAVAKEGSFVAVIDGVGSEVPGNRISTVYLFNKSGNLVWQHKIEIQPGRTPNVRFTDDGKYFLICNSNKLHCYRLMEGE
ncbi:hypothetical protein DRP53_03390 [candidate division WOR-3 bacterium]|uniref:Pyrrolo-quinoline quinone repeat domain-containing protein n=1 Tax=candidate division WOR-3 bacterium TaxID=2052148 RepID=A0A660SJ87_UNCW3|nr:MAG: hypothetical protein DRP53_03390 [candidate division WOR-3 bacterium]